MTLHELLKDVDNMVDIWHYNGGFEDDDTIREIDRRLKALDEILVLSH